MKLWTEGMVVVVTVEVTVVVTVEVTAVVTVEEVSFFFVPA